MSFDYRAQPAPASRRATGILTVGGAALLVVCAVWVFAPIVAPAGGATTTGTIASYHLEVAPAPGTVAQYRPVVEYAVDLRTYSFTASETVTAPDRRQLPVGSPVVVRYDPSDPSSAVWIPGGSVVAVNTLGIAGLVAGAGMLVAAIILRRAARPRRDADAVVRPDEDEV